ncbi:hypothetical protein FAZ95_31040 [Trinickia violacea]|uniref:Uncharacterized protein n=1 Tax=Trinickia violacea TaxID=2571746 RepID=A0A4V1EIE4_9BURK|nr:hypothetical protein FAZ95_31040 [Trinickia violacea]
MPVDVLEAKKTQPPGRIKAMNASAAIAYQRTDFASSDLKWACRLPSSALPLAQRSPTNECAAT